MKTWASKPARGLYVAGELVDVDGVTGGFNFMHAWASGFGAGRDAARYLGESDDDETLPRGY